MTLPRIGCNTLYPDGRLVDEREFTVSHHLRALDLLAEAGFDAVEYSHPFALSGRDLTRVATHTQALGLLPWSLHTWMSLPAREEEIPAALEAYADSAHRARALGVQVIVVHSAGGTDPLSLQTRRRANAKTLTALAEMVAPHITIAVENMSSRADWDFIIQMIRDLAAPNLGLNIDTGHAHLGDMGVLECIRMAGDLIRTTHLQDNHGQQDDHLPPGLGTIDWPATLAALRQAGYNGVYMVEISDCPPDREPDARAETMAAAQNLRALLHQVAS